MRKRKRSGKSREANVEVFPLAVTGHLTQWPEKGQRELRWFSVAEAAKAVDEPELQSIIAAFREPPADPGWFLRLLLSIREKLQLIPEKVGRVSGITPEQYKMIRTIVDSVQEEMHKTIIDMANADDTPSLLGEQEEVVL